MYIYCYTVFFSPLSSSLGKDFNMTGIPTIDIFSFVVIFYWGKFVLLVVVSVANNYFKFSYEIQPAVLGILYIVMTD